MAKTRTVSGPHRPGSFADVIPGHSRTVQTIAKALRDLVYEELPDAQETFYGGWHAVAVYRTMADIC